MLCFFKKRFIKKYCCFILSKFDIVQSKIQMEDFVKKINQIFTLLITFGPLTTNYAMERIAIRNISKNQSQKLSQYLLKNMQALKLINNQFSEIFNHPLYVKFFEPIYVGNKAEIWGHQIYNTPTTFNQYYQKFNQNILFDNFYKKIYINWKNLLTDEQLLQYENILNTYEKTYTDYQQNPLNPDRKKELLEQIKLINELINFYFDKVEIN